MLIAVAPSRAPPLNPAIRPFTGNNLRRQPSACAASGPPKGEAQGIPKQLAAFTGAGGRQIGRANANALAAEGDASEKYDAGGVIGIGGNPHPSTAGRGLEAQPVGEGGDLGGGVVARRQRISRRSPVPAAVAAGKSRPVLGGWAAIEHHNQIHSGQVLIGQPASWGWGWGWGWGSTRWRESAGSRGRTASEISELGSNQL